MREQLGKSRALWIDTATPPPAGNLTADTHADVCVVGAGVAGLSTAYLLTREGKSVIVLNDGGLVNGQTQRTTAHLSNAIDDRYFELERTRGADAAWLACESHTAAIERIGRAVADERIDCAFSRLDGYLFLGPDQTPDLLDKELEAGRRAGVAGLERLARAPDAPFDTGPCLRFPNQGQFDPMKYLAGLAKYVRDKGGRLFGNTRVVRVEGGTEARVHTKDGPRVTASGVVVATNTPVIDKFAIHTKQAPYLTYALGLAIPAGSVKPALYWDTLDPYHYVRTQPRAAGADDVLIVGGEDHKTGQADDGAERFARLEAWARQRFPSAQGVTHRWCGQVMETLDGLGFIGHNPHDADNIYIATGDSGMGMTHGTIAGMLLTDLILGRQNRWAPLYEPSRKPIRTAGDFVHENVNVAVQYIDRITGGDVRSAEEVPVGGGAVLRRGLSKVAVYRDEDGAPHKRSAICPHLGCVVHWNSTDATWDCPCHGSRFDGRGRVICGPAVSDLTALE